MKKQSESQDIAVDNILSENVNKEIMLQPSASEEESKISNEEVAVFDFPSDIKDMPAVSTYDSLLNQVIMGLGKTKNHA